VCILDVSYKIDKKMQDLRTTNDSLLKFVENMLAVLEAQKLALEDLHHELSGRAPEASTGQDQLN